MTARPEKTERGERPARPHTVAAAEGEPRSEIPTLAPVATESRPEDESWAEQFFEAGERGSYEGGVEHIRQQQQLEELEVQRTRRVRTPEQEQRRAVMVRRVGAITGAAALVCLIAVAKQSLHHGDAEAPVALAAMPVAPMATTAAPVATTPIATAIVPAPAPAPTPAPVPDTPAPVQSAPAADAPEAPKVVARPEPSVRVASKRASAHAGPAHAAAKAVAPAATPMPARHGPSTASFPSP